MELRNNDLFKGLDIEEIEDILKNISFTKIKYKKSWSFKAPTLIINFD